MFDLANWQGTVDLRAKLQARGFGLPNFYARVCSEFCDNSFSEADYLIEADAVALHNTRRDSFDPASPPLLKSRFDHVVLEKLGTLSWSDRYVEFYAKIDAYKLKESQQVVPIDDMLVHDAVAQQDYCTSAALEQGFSVSQSFFEQVKISSTKELGGLVGRIGIGLGRGFDVRMPTDNVQLHLYIGLSRPKRYARYIETEAFLPGFRDYVVNYSMSPTNLHLPDEGARSPSGRSQLAKLAILAHIAFIDELLQAWVTAEVKPIQRYLDAMKSAPRRAK